MSKIPTFDKVISSTFANLENLVILSKKASYDQCITSVALDTESTTELVAPVGFDRNSFVSGALDIMYQFMLEGAKLIASNALQLQIMQNKLKAAHEYHSQQTKNIKIANNHSLTHGTYFQKAGESTAQDMDIVELCKIYDYAKIIPEYLLDEYNALKTTETTKCLQELASRLFATLSSVASDQISETPRELSHELPREIYEAIESFPSPLSLPPATKPGDSANICWNNLKAQEDETDSLCISAASSRSGSRPETPPADVTSRNPDTWAQVEAALSGLIYTWDSTDHGEEQAI